MKQTFRIYGLIDPRDHRFYYVGRTGRALHDRLDEHFFAQGDTRVSGKNQAIQKSGQLPQVVVLDAARDETTAFHRELYWIHKLASEGHTLKNREAQAWFVRRYEERVSGRGQSPPAKTGKKGERTPKKQPLLLKAETYRKAKELAPGVDIQAEEAAWRKWLAQPGKTPPRNPDAHFLTFLGNAVK